MTPRLGAIIVNYNAGPELRQALESIDRATCSSWQAVVVDNGSTDGSEAAATAFVQVRLVRNSENVGFARGVNQAIRDCPADRILIMNPDCQLMPDSLPPLMAVLDDDPRCAIVAPRAELHPQRTPAGVRAATLVHDAEIEPMDEAAVAALLAEVPHARPRPFPIGDDVVADAPAHGPAAAHAFAIGRLAAAAGAFGSAAKSSHCRALSARRATLEFTRTGDRS